MFPEKKAESNMSDWNGKYKELLQTDEEFRAKLKAAAVAYDGGGGGAGAVCIVYGIGWGQFDCIGEGITSHI